MTKPRGVKFQHRANGVDHRRPSSSTDASEPASPMKDSERRSGSVVPNESKPAEQSEYEKKKATFITRAIWTLVMIAAFFAAMFAGHIYILAMITAVQILSFKEVIAIAQVPQKQKELPMTRSLNWYFFAITMYFLYGESVVYYFKHILLVDKVLLPFATHHRFISFMMYIIGLYLSRLRARRYLTACRIRLLRRLTEEGLVQVPIYAIRLDAYGFVPHRLPGSLHDEQCL
jgi:phosphatidate cytidylyltransferase